MSHVVLVKIYDLGTTALADISGISLTKEMVRQINGPRSFQITAPAADPLLTTVAADGAPNLCSGRRKLVVWEGPADGTPPNPATDTPIFHGRIFTIERDGTENDVLVTVTAYDPWMELGFEGNNQAGRPVRSPGSTPGGEGDFTGPTFTPTPPGQTGVSGPDLMQQILTFSQADPTTNPIQGEGPLPIDVVSGVWDLDVPPAIDLSINDKADWPVQIGDFFNQLIQTGVVDLDMKPVLPGTGKNLSGVADPYVMVEASAQSKMGTDRSATVHFDYLTGSFNAAGCKQVEDFTTYMDRLWYELGPRIDQHHWRGDITPHAASVSSTLIPSDNAAAIYGGPPGAAIPGRMASVRVLDSLGNENLSRPLYVALYEDESKLRRQPRLLLYITPAADSKALFEPPQDYDAFDLVQIKTGSGFGVVLNEAQRVYGYTKTWTPEGVATVGQLITKADVS